jgi:hypothetical protein
MKNRKPPSELISKYEQYIKNPKYFKMLEIKKWIKEIYVET